MTKVTTVGNLLVQYNTIHDSYTNTKTGELVTGTLLFPEATTPESKQTGVPPLIDRIISLFPEKYNECTIGYLGYRDNSINDKDNIFNTLTVNQVLNSQYRMVANKGKTKTIFNMNRMHHRPIFLGVNVLYDPPLEYETDKPLPPSVTGDDNTKDYYNAEDAVKAARGERDMSFSAQYLKDLQYYAEYPDKENIVLTMIRKGFSMGIGSVNADNLSSSANLPVQFSRIFHADEKGSGNFSVVSMESTSERIKPSDKPLKEKDASEEEEGKEPKKYNLLNTTVEICIPTVKDSDGRTMKDSGRVVSLDVSTPCIVFTGEQLDGYELASYIAVPICSWTAFQNDRDYKDSKAVERLRTTNTCGPFIRVIANGYYTAGASAVLSSYTEIVLKGSDDSEDGVQFTYDGDKEIYKNKEGKTIFEPTMSVHETLLAAAAYMWDKSKEYKSLEKVIDDEVFYNGFERSAASSYEAPIQGLFNATELPLRFGFFRVDKNLYIRQYPASPVIGDISPIEDDYITQLVPTYRLKDNASYDDETGGTVWYINRNDILVDSWNNKGFYTPSSQKFKSTTKSAADADPNDNRGFMYTYTGYLYPGEAEWNRAKDTKKPDSVNTGLPDSIMCIEATDGGSNYCTDKILIAPDNYLAFMPPQLPGDLARVSRAAYKEYIKNGAVFLINDEEPSNNPVEYIPDTEPKDMKLNEYSTIEPTLKTAEVQSHMHVGVIVGIVVTVLFLIGAAIWRYVKYKKTKESSTDETSNTPSDEVPLVL